MGLDELPAWIHRIAHQHVERAVGLSRVLHRDEQQGPILGVHRRLPQLDRVHFTETFVTLEGRLLANFLDDLILILFYSPIIHR